MLTLSIVKLVRSRWAAILNPLAPPSFDVGLSGIALEDGNVVMRVQATGEELESLEVDHNVAEFLPEFRLYADSGNVWGNPESVQQAIDLGVDASYRDGMWTLTLLAGGEALNTVINERDGEVRFFFVARNKRGGTSGSMAGGDYFELSHQWTFD